MNLEEAKETLSDVVRKYHQKQTKVNGGTLTVQKVIIAKLPLPFESLEELSYHDLLAYEVPNEINDFGDFEVLIWAKFEPHDYPPKLYCDYYCTLPHMYRTK
jgi:hypothetical protein